MRIILEYSLMIFKFIAKIIMLRFGVYQSSSFIAFMLLTDILSFFDPSSY